jgi:hypothetical protein
MIAKFRWCICMQELVDVKIWVPQRKGNNFMDITLMSCSPVTISLGCDIEIATLLEQWQWHSVHWFSLLYLFARTWDSQSRKNCLSKSIVYTPHYLVDKECQSLGCWTLNLIQISGCQVWTIIIAWKGSSQLQFLLRCQLMLMYTGNQYS